MMSSAGGDLFAAATSSTGAHTAATTPPGLWSGWILLVGLCLIWAGLVVLRRKVYRSEERGKELNVSFLGVLGRGHALHLVQYQGQQLLVGVWQGGMAVLDSRQQDPNELAEQRQIGGGE